MIQYPKISPDIIRFGNFAIRWYSMMYLMGYIIGYQIFKWRREKGLFRVSKEALENYITYLVLGMLIGARVFYVVFYNFDYYTTHPAEAFMIWHGGLSFHGATFGMIVACWLYGKKYSVQFLEVTDAMAYAAGPGLFLGRIGNFINGELYGRPSNVPWAMIFPADEKQVPRHPSQLYQGLTEGLLLWFILLGLQYYLLKKNNYRPGYIGGTFLAGYGLFRFLTEFTREPDVQVGYFFGWITMGQILCLVMIIAGIFVIYKGRESTVIKVAK